MNATRPSAAVVAALALAAASAPAAREATHAVGQPRRDYTLLLPAGETAARPVAVFLRGTKEAKLARFRAEWAPIFLANRCLVAIPAPSAERMWRYADANHIVAVIDDIQTRYRTDPNAVILMGVSGGGQTALFLADHAPEAFRAVVAVSTNPVVVRGRDYEWFYPAEKTAKSCPYFVVNHITQGSALRYWRQVRARRGEAGASISILPALGDVSHYLPPPKEFAGWLKTVVAGKHPEPIPDPQRAAVAKMLADAVGKLPAALEAATPAADANTAAKAGEVFRLAVPVPPGWRRGKREQKSDAADRPITQVRLEHAEAPLYLRCDARRTDALMSDVLAAEQKRTARRGLLYQLYRTADLKAGRRTWRLMIGSITYPDRTRGWVSTLFLHAAAPIANNPKRWLEVTLMDETMAPDPAVLAAALQTVLAGVEAKERGE